MSSLRDYSDAYMLVKGTITVANNAAIGQPANNANKKVIFKNCASFINCISRIKDTQADDASSINPKNKKTHPPKNSLYFRKWNFLALILKKYLFPEMKPRIFRPWLYFQPRKNSRYFRKCNFLSPSPKKFLIFPEMEPCAFQSKLEKIKKIPPGENFLYFKKQKRQKKLSIFSQKQVFLMFWEKGTPKKLFKFQEVTCKAREMKNPPLKNFLYFRRWNFSIPSLKNSYISVRN